MKVLSNIGCNGRNINAEVERTDGCDGSWIMTLAYTSFALVAFAANSVIYRVVLGSEAIDAASFSTIRLVSGALALALVFGISQTGAERKSCGSWTSAGMLCLYAVAFSFAYINLSAGTGALILFGSVQVTMILGGLRQNERFGWRERCGLIIGGVGSIFILRNRIAVFGASGDPAVPGLGFRYDRDDRWPYPNPTGREGVMEGFCPPHDLDFYDEFYKPGAYLKTHADHMQRWHNK